MINQSPALLLSPRRCKLGSSLLIGIAALAAGCGTTEKEPEPIVTVQVMPAKRGPIALTVSAEAVVSPLQQAVITPKISSTISKFYVQRGSHVKQGELLALLENADLAGAAEQSKGEFEQAEAGYATTTGASLPQQIQKAELDAAAAKAAFDAQQKVYDARKDLFSQGAIPHRDFDSAEVALAQARSQNEQAQKQLADLLRLGKEQQLKSASGQLSAAKGKYLNARAQLSYSEIRSPIDGVVTDRPLFPGELATANQPILTVMNTSKLIAKAHIAQNEAVLLQIGNPAELKLAGVTEPIKARVMLISPALDPSSTTIEVWIEALKLGPALKPGMNVDVIVTAKSLDDVLVVPASAVYKTPEGHDYVLLAGPDNKAHLAKVKIGIRTKELAEIASGIKESDSVITSGGYALPDGTRIKIEAAAAAESEKDSADQGDKPTETPGKKPAKSAAPAKAEE
ncbi:MAG TPA: efflux RND transporter periplasmic adaptor subunit [Verrucomicrobiae bacterium]|nr:efflux RND transporter periplasmic adaptor subunit [Verrucomicrobiae bacterium]